MTSLAEARIAAHGAPRRPLNYRTLATEFPNAKGFATHRNAEKAMAKARAADFFAGGPVIETIVFRMEDSRWLPVMIVGRDVGGYIAGPCQFNVCVTNL